MFDAEVNHQLLAEIRHVRVILSRWIIFQVVLGALALGSAFYYVHEQARNLKEAEMRIAFAGNLESRLVREISKLVEKISTPKELPRSPSGQVLYPGPSAPPKFPSGTRFVSDPSQPKGYRAVNE